MTTDTLLRGMLDPEEELDLIVKKIERGELPKIQFEFDSDEILLESYPTLDAVADLLRPRPTLKLMVRAHTCTVGSEAYNLDLSQRRAKSVKTFLVKRGIPPPSIRYRGLGFSQPVADNSTEKGRARNRRVEFRVTTRDWPSSTNRDRGRDAGGRRQQRRQQRRFRRRCGIGLAAAGGSARAVAGDVRTVEGRPSS